MPRIGKTPTASDSPPSRERGSALILALVLTIILTFLGFGLLSRSLLVSRIAGSERWSTKAFYAADAGISAARARLTIRRTAAFNFNLTDLRGPDPTGLSDHGQIDIAVSDLAQVGAPQPVVGSQVGGGQGAGSEPLFIIFYRGTSAAQAALTRSERVITATLSIGPVPLAIPQ